jgi:hypothetical protein
MCLRMSARVASIACVAVFVSRSDAGAQRPRLERTVDIAGNYLYGNQDQFILSARGGLAFRDTLWGARLDSRYLIGVGSANGVRRMDRRSWLISGSLDRRPEDLHSQFILASIEESLELRVRSRANIGAGWKYVIDCDTTYQLDVSAALVGEVSVLPIVGNPMDLVRSQLLRLSNRVRYRNQFTDKVNVDHVTWLRPRVDNVGDLLGSSSTSIGYVLTKHASLRLSFINDYDSRSRARGARSNHNGQMVVGVAAKF